MPKPKFDTLEEAKQYLRENWEKGVECPCCKQFVKLYKRKLTSGMAIGLIRLYHASRGDISQFVHITSLGHLNGGEFAQLKRWNLISEQENENETKRTSGMWSITEAGIRFVTGQSKVRSHVFTYNGATMGTSKSVTSIQEALGKKFDYEEIMAEHFLED